MMDRKSWPRRIAAGVALGLAGVAAGWVLFPSEPELLRGLPAGWDARNAELVHRVAARFPAGSGEGAMRQALLDQGFAVSPGVAHWERRGDACRTFVEIRWQVADGRVTGTSASTFEACR